MLKTCPEAMVISGHTKQQRALQRITMLPQPLLELILIKTTSTADKKALRRTCKLFRQVLDDNLACVSIGCREDKDLHDVLNLLKRLEHVHSLRAAYLSCSHGLGALIKHLPRHLSTLEILCNVNASPKEFEPLRRLRCLTTVIMTCSNPTPGLQHVSGLTSLQTLGFQGTLAHLAPTLKKLDLADFNDVQDMDQLTSLEMLHLWLNPPTTFFKTHGHLPLKQLRLSAIDGGYFPGHITAAPTALTRLALRGCHNVPEAVPTSVTHLQLLDTTALSVQQAIAHLPLLVTLDVHMRPSQQAIWHSAFTHLSQLNNLQSLGLCIQCLGAGHVSHLTREKVLLYVPIAEAVKRGVKLNVVEVSEEFVRDFNVRTGYKTRWNIQFQ